MSKNDEKSDKSDRNAYLQFRRIIKIDYLLANDVYPSSKRLMEDDDIGCSRATLMRDIEFLRDEMRAPIEYDNYRKGYYYSNKTYRLPMQFLSDRELEAINFLERYLPKFEITPFYEPLKTVLESLKNKSILNPHEKPFDVFGDKPEFNFMEDVDFSWMDERLSMPGYFGKNDSDKIDSDTWEKIKKAIKTNRVITFNCQKRRWRTNELKIEKVKAAPYEILCNSSSWEMWGLWYDKETGKERKRLFNLSEIVDVEITKEKFILPAKYKYEDTRSPDWSWDDVKGILDEEKIYLKFKIDAKFSVQAKAQFEWTRSNRYVGLKIEEQKDGSLIVTFRCVAGNLEFRKSPHNYFPSETWGDNVTPLEPPELVEAWNKMPEGSDLKYYKLQFSKDVSQKVIDHFHSMGPYNSFVDLKMESAKNGTLIVSYRKQTPSDMNFLGTKNYYTKRFGDNVTPLEPKELVKAWGE